MDSKIAAALEQLNRLPMEERLAALDLLAEKRRKTSFIKYFEPWSEQKLALPYFTDDIKVFGLLGGNRSGKTILGAFIACAWALGKSYFKDEPSWEWIKDLPIPEDHPRNVWIVGLDYNVLRDVLWYEKLRHGKNHPPFLPDDGSVVKFSDKEYQVFFANGSVITGKSADAGREKFQGASVDLVWIDEECEKDIYDECYMRTSDCGGKILLTLTPLTDMDSGVRTPWVFDLYEDWMAGDESLHFCQLSTLNSPFISDKEKKLMLEKLDGDPEKDARLYGKFVRRSGLVYPSWKKESYIVRDFIIPALWPKVVTIDPAATGVTAALWIAISPTGDYYLYKEYYEKDLIVSEHVKNILMRCGGEPIDWWILDPYWGRQRNAETHKTGHQLYIDAGLKDIRLPEIGSDDFALLASREYINATLSPNSRHPKLYITEGLPNFEFEISHYTWDRFQKGEQKGQTKEKPRKRNDHLLNAMQYACSQKFKGASKRFKELSVEEREKRAKLQSYT
jgi:phage terminase large subunit-like protein